MENVIPKQISSQIGIPIKIVDKTSAHKKKCEILNFEMQPPLPPPQHQKIE